MGARLPFLLPILLWASISTAQECELQTMTDMKIDIRQATARGARFTDPITVATVQECVSSCCTQLIRGGDLACNLAIYDVRKRHSPQNCYLFHCPQLDSCPMMPTLGVLSYTLWTATETNISQPTEPKPRPAPKPSGRNKTLISVGKNASSALHLPGSTMKKSSAAADGPRDPARKNPGTHSAASEGDTPERITAQLLHLAEDVDKHLEKLESESHAKKGSKIAPQATFPSAATSMPTAAHKQPPDIERPPSEAGAGQNPPEAHSPSHAPRTTRLEPTRTWHRPVTVTLRPVPRAKPTYNPPPTSTPDTRGADKKPNAEVMAGHHGANSTTTPKPTEKSVMTYTQAPLAPPVTAPPVLQTSTSKTTLVNDPHSSTRGAQTPPHPKSSTSPPIVYLGEESRQMDIMGSAPRNKPSIDDRSGLVAALVFGVAFLVMVIGLITRKVTEARRRNQYTKLDYLINGMYVDA